MRIPPVLCVHVSRVVRAPDAFVVFGASVYAGLRAFAHAFAARQVRSLARARLLYPIFF